MTDLVAATGFRDGILHAEWFLVEGEFPHLVECAGRLAGDHITTLIDLVYGGSSIADLLAILAGYGDSVTRERRPRRGASIRFLVTAPGTVRAITGVAQARSMTGVFLVDMATEVGALGYPRHQLMGTSRAGHGHGAGRGSQCSPGRGRCRRDIHRHHRAGKGPFR